MCQVANDILGVPLPNLTQYDASVQHLVQYPIDADGFMIAKNCPFAESHRHFSHLSVSCPCSFHRGRSLCPHAASSC